MPDAPRTQVGVAFPAYQTPSGLLPQAAREHTSDYAETQGHAQELARRTDGVWIDVPYSPARFLGDGTALSLWQVERKGVLANRYKAVGAQAEFSFNLTGTIAGVAASLVRMVLPERLRLRQTADAMVWGQSGATLTPVLAHMARHDRTILFYRFDFQAWALGSCVIVGQLVCEVEEF